MSRTTPAHKWTHDGKKVLLVKCVEADGTSYGGFVWPESGHVEPDNWSDEPTCESGGLFGWPWGIGIGCGKLPDYKGRWIVFAASPDEVVDLGDKCKARCGEVIYCGDWYTALRMVDAGRVAWCEHTSIGAASSTGYRGAASSTGYRGAASSTGHGGAASSTGYSGAASSTGHGGAASSTGHGGAASSTGERGAASSTGERGAASSTGYRGAASSTGYRGAASSTGHGGAASSTGESGAASSTGERGAASSTGYRGAASSTGHGGAASSTGYSGAASSTGESGAASSTGERGAASSTGHGGAASSTGYRGIASTTGFYSEVHSGPGGIACTTSEECTWAVNDEAVLIQRWRGADGWKTAVLDPRRLGLSTGVKVYVVRGKIQNAEFKEDMESCRRRAHKPRSLALG